MANITRIAIVDSGAGGIALLRKVMHLPYNFLYIADTEYMPYGDKSRNTLIERAYHLADYAIDKFEAQLIVVACNTLTVAAIDALRNKYSGVTFLGCEPPLKQALQYTASNALLVCTQYTAQRYYKMQLPNVRVNALPRLASMVEQGSTDKQICQYIANNTNGLDCDCIALGCTHYSHVKHCFEQVYPALKIFDSVDGAVAHLRKTVLKKHRGNMQSSIQWYLTKPSEQTLGMYNKLLYSKYQ